MIIVTGSTGHLGNLVIQQLLRRISPEQVVAGARSPDKAKRLADAGVDVRKLDYDRPETIGPALQGIQRALLISANEFGKRFEQHKRVIDAAKKEGVEHLVYTSIVNADPEMLISGEHIQTEDYIKASGLPYTILRNGWYHENWLGNLGATLEHGVLLGAAGDGVVTPAARNDYAEAAAVVLTSEGHASKTYELAGDTGYSLENIASIIAEVGGKPVRYQNLSEAEYAKALEGFGLPAPVAKILANADTGLRRGSLRNSGGTLARLIGRPTTPLEDTVREAL